MALQKDINNLDSQIDEKFDPKKILDVVHSIEDTITSLDDSKQLDDNKDLLQAIRSFSNLIRKIVKKLQNLEDQEKTIKRLERQCHDLQEKCMELERKCIELERKYTELDNKHERAREKELKLMAGQLAFEIEKAVTSKVLSGIIIEGYQHINTIYEMEEAIKGNLNYADIFPTVYAQEIAEKRWVELKGDLKWSGKHFRYIRTLKRFRRSDAHPEFNSKAVKEALESGALEVVDEALYKE